MDDKENESKQPKYVFAVLVLLIVIAALFLIRSFIITVISGMVLAYIFYPPYKKIRRIVKSENAASFITLFLVVIIIFIPLIFVGNALINQSLQFFYRVRSVDFEKIDDIAAKYLDENIELESYASDTVNNFALAIAKKTSDLIVAIPKKIISLFVILFLMFYLFKEGENLFKKVQNHIPLKKTHREHLTSRLNGVVYGTIYGIVITAFIQGAIGTLGLWIFNVPSPILWGLVMVILAMIPFVGASFVWFPAAVYKIFTDEVFNGVGLLLYGLLIVSTIDNIIRPKIIGVKGKIHPVLVLLGVLGGLEVFGFLGVIIGPLILAALAVAVEIYMFEKKETQRSS